MTKFILKLHPQGDIWVSLPEWFTNHIGDSLEIRKGGILSYAESQLDAIKEALINFQQKNDTTKASIGVILTFSSGQVSSAMTTSPWTSLLIQSNDIVSFSLLSLFFTMGRLLWAYLMISWPSLLLGGMSQHHHSPTSFRVWVPGPHLTAIG